jgi:hypothetical protein
MGHRLDPARAKLPNPAVEIFVHGVDSLLCAVRVHVALYVMRCDHGHNLINRLNWLSDNGHAAGPSSATGRATPPGSRPHGRRANGGMKRPGSAWGQKSGQPFETGGPPPGSRLRDDFPTTLENSLLERTTNTIAKIPRTGVQISFP